MYPSAIDEILVATVESTDFAIEITLLSEFSKLTKYVFLDAKSFVFCDAKLAADCAYPYESDPFKLLMEVFITYPIWVI